MGRPRRDNRSSRRTDIRRSTDQVLVVSGGEKTEPAYFNGLRDAFQNRTLQVKIVPDGRAPTRLVREAHRLGDGYDQVWCVFDVDNFAQALTDGVDDLTKAVIAAGRAKINLAISNPCFELWLLLHFAGHTAYLADARRTRSKLREHVPTYDKDRLDFQHFQDRVDDAVARAKALDPGDGHCPANPSTGVWELVELLRPKR